MRFGGVLLAVRDLERAKVFYKSVFGLDVQEDFGSNVALTEGLFLQTLESWSGFVHEKTEDIVFYNKAVEVYFEVDDMDGFMLKLASMPDIEYVHRLHEHSWGQRSIRIYDVDGHIIEIGEDMHSVVKCFLDTGMSDEEVAKRMDVAVAYVRKMK